MEINEDVYDPESNFESLVKQVEEQSEFCDVTVRFGDWARKFHRCVLSASLLFQIIITAHIVETKKDNGDAMVDNIPDAIIEVKIDTTPDVLEMAIMFMYGIIPDFNIRNIGDLLELADYLKLKDLKEACLDWLHHIHYSKGNCMYVIHLSKKYQFEIPPCIEYIEGHIPETLQHDDAVDLPTDLIENLFTDVKFSYVEMDDKLHFLVKLFNKPPAGSSKETVAELFKTIDLKEISETTWKYAESDENFSRMVNLGQKVRPKGEGNSETHVMIIPSQDDYFACLDLQTNKWYRLNSSFFESYSYCDQIFIGIRNNNPEVYYMDPYDDWDDSLILTSVDLQSDEVRRVRFGIDFEYFIDEYEEIVDEKTTHVNFTNETLIAIVQKTVHKYKSSTSSESETENESENEPELVCSNRGSEAENENDRNEVFEAQVSPEIIPNTSTEDDSCMMPAPGLQVDEPSTSLSRHSPSNCERDGFIFFTDVYIGNASEDSELQPLFSFRNERITQICVNVQSVLALLTKAGGRIHVILYDMLQFKMERIFSVQKGDYELCPTDNGFLMHDDTHCYCFTKPVGSASLENYKIETCMLENNEEWYVKYHYQGGFWMRILRRSMHNDIELQYISHEDLTVCNASLDVNWRNVSMPEDKCLFEKVKNFKDITIVALPKRKLRCNIACPHCRYVYSEEMF